MKVLLVDDEPAIREQSKTFLEDIYGDLTITGVGSVDVALERLEEEYFSAIVSDYQMPGKDGLDFLEKLRGKGDDTPFIIFTGKGREEVAMKALNLGAERYIQKGGDPRSQYTVLAQSIKQSVEHKNAQTELIRSEKEKSSILNSLSEIVVHQNEDGNIIWANKSFADEVEYDLNEITGKKCHDIWFDRDERCEGCPIVESFKSNKREEGLITSDDGNVWYIRGEPIKKEDGEVIGMLEIAQDITQQKKVEEELRDSKERFQKLVETTPTAIWIIDESKFIYVNKTAKRITGYDKSSLLSMKITDIVDEEQKELVEERLSSIQKGEKAPSRFVIEIENNSGETRYLYLASTQVDYGGKDVVLCSSIDITEEKQLEDALREYSGM